MPPWFKPLPTLKASHSQASAVPVRGDGWGPVTCLLPLSVLWKDTEWGCNVRKYKEKEGSARF